MTQRNWKTIKEYEDILFDYHNGIARITINRPRYRNAFTPTTTSEMSDALRLCREMEEVSVVVLTGAGDKAFCSGEDQNVKGKEGYIGKDGVPRLNVLDVQKQIRSIPKPVIAMVNGYAIGGGHVLHVVCDLTIAADNAIFGQTGPRVAASTAAMARAILPASLDRRRRVKSGICAASTMRRKPSTWAWSIRLSPLIALRMKAWNGRRPSSATALSPSECSRGRSTPTWTGRPDFNSLPVT